MTKALVLAGGGTRGAYQAGAVKALKCIDENHWDFIVGVSVGSLNGALIVQNDYEVLYDMYNHLTADRIINGQLIQNRKASEFFDKNIQNEIKSYIKEKGLDVSPFVAYTNELFHPDAFFSSSIDYACLTATKHKHEAVFVTKEEMKVHGADWLIASSSAYPVFPVKVIDGNEYVDGGYYDNCPIDYALRGGFDTLDVIDMNFHPNHPQFIRRSHINYIYPYSETGDFLDFSKEKMQKLMQLGYNDAMKVYHKYQGFKYTFENHPLPKLLKSFYREVEIAETSISLANAAIGKLRSNQYITDYIKKKYHIPYVKEEDYFFAMMDLLFDLIEAKEEEVYTIYQAKSMIFDFFKEATNSNYVPNNPSLFTKARIVTKLNQQAIITQLIHSSIYPLHKIISDETVYTVYPLLKVVASFVYMWMKEEEDDNSI